MIRKLMVAFMVIGSLYGCSSVQEVGLAIEGDKPGDVPHYLVLRDHLSGRFFGQNLQTGVMYHCTGVYSSEQMAEIRQYIRDASWYYGCKKKDTQVIAGQSSMSQLQGPVAAAVLGGAIGAGLALSGDDNTTNNNNSAAGGTGGAGGKGGSASNMVNSGNKVTNIRPSTNINSNNVFKGIGR